MPGFQACRTRSSTEMLLQNYSPVCGWVERRRQRGAGALDAFGSPGQRASRRCLAWRCCADSGFSPASRLRTLRRRFTGPWWTRRHPLPCLRTRLTACPATQCSFRNLMRRNAAVSARARKERVMMYALLCSGDTGTDPGALGTKAPNVYEEDVN